jgi:hypothetical protein
MDIRDAGQLATATLKGSPRWINEGLCFRWAGLVFNKVEGSKIAGHNRFGQGHSWVEYAGKCYDAECLEGVETWIDLPFWQRLGVIS